MELFKILMIPRAGVDDAFMAITTSAKAPEPFKKKQKSLHLEWEAFELH